MVSCHREENVDNRDNLLSILKFLDMLAKKYGKRIIVSTHPRTRKKLVEINQKIDINVEFLKPFGFFDYVNLQMNACCTISDSGSISEESAMLDFPL